jgi:hypothetical protein
MVLHGLRKEGVIGKRVKIKKRSLKIMKYVLRKR